MFAVLENLLVVTTEKKTERITGASAGLYKIAFSDFNTEMLTVITNALGYNKIAGFHQITFTENSRVVTHLSTDLS